MTYGPHLTHQVVNLLAKKGVKRLVSFVGEPLPPLGVIGVYIMLVLRFLWSS